MTEAKIELSIVIVSYNTKKITQNCLDSIVKSLKSTKITYEIIVIDNASTDGTVEAIENGKLRIGHSTSLRPMVSEIESIENLKIIVNKKNVGFAKANNQGTKVASGKYILFLNSDITVLDNAIENLLNFYKENENKIHFLGGKLLNKDLSPQPSAGPFYTLPIVFGALFLRGDYWGLTRYSPNGLKEVDWVSGACILTKKIYFETIGGFDEAIFMYMDEIDLLFRAKKNNYRIFFYPEARFIHLGSASSGKRTYPILQVYRGFLYFYKKHMTSMELAGLKIMLQLKAIVGIILGNLFRNTYLKETYGEAFKIVQMG